MTRTKLLAEIIQIKIQFSTNKLPHYSLIVIPLMIIIIHNNGRIEEDTNMVEYDTKPFFISENSKSDNENTCATKSKKSSYFNKN